MEEQTGTGAEAESFMRKALEAVEKTKREEPNDATYQDICDAFAYCLERFYTKSETVSHMATDCGYDAESVRALYDSFVSHTADISGGEAYTKHSEEAKIERNREARILSGSGIGASVSPYCEQKFKKIKKKTEQKK